VVEESDGDLMGDGVNIAARIESIAKPGAICLSEDAYRQGSGPELQLPSLLPIMSEASLYRPRAACSLGYAMG
jgi:class 3 adenylate cyclase